MKSLLQYFGVSPVVYELNEIPRGHKIEAALASLGHNTTWWVPAVFIDGEPVGGANEVMSLHLQQNLRPMLNRGGAM